MATKIIAVELSKLEYANITSTGVPGTWKELDNIHEDTFKYSESEVQTDPYKDVKGNIYYNDVKTGEKSIQATIGKYDLETKAELQGGTYKAPTSTSGATWTPPETPTVIYKAVRITTKDGLTITFPKAQVVANAVENKKAIGQGVKFIPLKPDNPVLNAEVWDDGVKA